MDCDEDKKEIPHIRRDFGSFHSSNLQEQIEIADSDRYIAPPVLVEPPTFEEYSVRDFDFGHAAKVKHFHLEKDCTFLNHGAFGAVLREVLNYVHQWQEYVERQPVRFFDRILFPQLVHVQKRLAEFVGCRTSDITLISNVTTGVNAVLQNMDLTADSTIYCLNTTYGAVKKTISHVSKKSGAKMQEENLNFPVQEDDILDLIERTLQKGTTLAVFDHIPSNYAFIMPVKEIVQLCHERGVPVLIDGAHALGALPLNVREIGADFYVSNAHKWFCAAKGCGFLYVKKELQPTTRGVNVSHGYGFGFHAEFTWTGLRDYTAYLSLNAVLNFWNSVGPDNIRKYMRGLLRKAAMMLCVKWDGKLLAPLEMHGSLCCISVPATLQGSNPSYSDCEALQNRLYHDYNIEVPIKCIESKLYVRISSHIHNQMDDYEKLGEAVSEIAEKVEN